MRIPKNEPDTRYAWLKLVNPVNKSRSHKMVALTPTTPSIIRRPNQRVRLVPARRSASIKGRNKSAWGNP